jgi:ABC-type uncharacterized transport system fused permease/ATPase subunit
MARLWPAASGSINMPNNVGSEGVFFLPQRMHSSPQFMFECF